MILKKLQLIFISLLFSTQIVNCQKIKFSLNRPSLQKIDSFETKNNGVLKTNHSVAYSISKNYFPNSDNFNLAQPISYLRETKPLKTSVQYFYSVPDSIIRLLQYTCNSTSDGVSELNKVFENNAAQFSEILGKKGETKIENEDDLTKKSTVWENEVIYINQFIITSSNTHRVRVLISWK